MLVLALDTSTPTVSVALTRDRVVLVERAAQGTNRHGELLAPLLAAALAEAGHRVGDLDAVAAGCGPGPYTGLRVGLVTAAALADAVGIPAYPVCSLDALAFGAADVVAVTDARRREVYWAAYGPDGARVLGPAVSAPADVPLDGRGALGPATRLYPELLPGTLAWPRAAAVSALAADRADRRSPGEPLTPLYLRRPDARVPGAPKAVLR